MNSIDYIILLLPVAFLALYIFVLICDFIGEMRNILATSLWRYLNSKEENTKPHPLKEWISNILERLNIIYPPWDWDDDDFIITMGNYGCRERKALMAAHQKQKDTEGETK